MSTLKEIATMINDTMSVREASYVPPAEGMMCGHYSKSIGDAASEVCKDENDAYLVSCFVFSCWNDAADWATRELAKKEAKS